MPLSTSLSLRFNPRLKKLPRKVKSPPRKRWKKKSKYKSSTNKQKT